MKLAALFLVLMATTKALPKTSAPVTAAPTTAASTTAAQSTAAPTTVAQTTTAPTRAAQTTAAPTTVAQTTAATTTAAPTTAAQTTAPTTIPQTTAAPTTVAQTTSAPTTAAPTTVAQTTAAPTTAAQTTVAPTTVAQTTSAPTTDAFVALCGRVNPTGGRRGKQNRIVGGVETGVNEYPWQVGLVIGGGNTHPFCGGSIINEWWILTAAHCIQRRGFHPNNVVIVVGEHTWSTGSETDATSKYGMDMIVVHPNYKQPTTHDHDIALLRLKKPIHFDRNNKVAPICPPSPNVNYDTPEAIATGWGARVQGEGTADSLHAVRVPTMTNANCQSDYKEQGEDIVITDNMICATAPEGGKDTCQGDSGGPLIVKDEGESIHRQIGVTSFGIGCGTAGNPGVYSRITDQLEWIKNSIFPTSWDNLKGSLSQQVELQRSAVECPSPWFRLGNQCFLDVLSRLAWTEARVSCANKVRGGDLALPNDLYALDDYIEAKYNGHDFWIAGTDMRREGDWRWLNGTSIDKGWFPGEPNNSGAKNVDEDCLVIRSWDGGERSLNDESCERALNYICQRPLLIH